MTDSDTSRLAVAVILSSTREGRQGEKVARWVHARATARPELAVELVDLRDLRLPDYPYDKGPRFIEHEYTDEAARRAVAMVERHDAFIVVTPEYNHGYTAALKNLVDHVYAGWNRKPVAFASYGGSSGGVRAVQQLRQVFVEVQAAPLRAEVNRPFVFRAFDDATGAPREAFHDWRAETMLDELAWWGRALRDGRQRIPAPAPRPMPR